ncbi:hypothetical protein, partial [uncultured Sneathiella sp.]|uniref:hypothetical protein n=1 Tax=uncultured Sneathiella sp. TaxID=879315 RepID=UPI0030DB8C4C
SFMLWGTKRYLIPNSFLSRTSNFSITACTETSAAEAGSSKISNFSERAMARTILTRAFCPPDS